MWRQGLLNMHKLRNTGGYEPVNTLHSAPENFSPVQNGRNRSSLLSHPRSKRKRSDETENSGSKTEIAHSTPDSEEDIRPKKKVRNSTMDDSPDKLKETGVRKPVMDGPKNYVPDRMVLDDQSRQGIRAMTRPSNIFQPSPRVKDDFFRNDSRTKIDKLMKPTPHDSFRSHDQEQMSGSAGQNLVAAKPKIGKNRLTPNNPIPSVSLDSKSKAAHRLGPGSGRSPDLESRRRARSGKDSGPIVVIPIEPPQEVSSTSNTTMVSAVKRTISEEREVDSPQPAGESTPISSLPTPSEHAILTRIFGEDAARLKGEFLIDTPPVVAIGRLDLEETQSRHQHPPKVDGDPPNRKSTEHDIRASHFVSSAKREMPLQNGNSATGTNQTEFVLKEFCCPPFDIMQDQKTAPRIDIKFPEQFFEILDDDKMLKRVGLGGGEKAILSRSEAGIFMLVQNRQTKCPEGLYLGFQHRDELMKFQGWLNAYPYKLNIEEKDSSFMTARLQEFRATIGRPITSSRSIQSFQHHKSITGKNSAAAPLKRAKLKDNLRSHTEQQDQGQKMPPIPQKSEFEGARSGLRSSQRNPDGTRFQPRDRSDPAETNEKRQKRDVGEEHPPSKYFLKKEHEPQWIRPLIFPKTGLHKANVDFQDLQRLDDENFLNDNIVFFCLRYAQQRLEKSSKRVYIFNSFFFDSLTKPVNGKKGINFDLVRKWTAKANFFGGTYDYIVVPINENFHWYAAIIANVQGIKKKLPSTDPAKLNEIVTTRETPPEKETRIYHQSETLKNQQYTDVYSDEDVGLVNGTARMSIQETADNIEGIVNKDSAFSRASPQAQISSRTNEQHNPHTEGLNGAIWDLSTTPPVDKEGDLAPSGTSPKSLDSTMNSRKSKRKSVVRKWDPDQPTVLIMDSLKETHKAAIRVLKDYLVAEALDKTGSDIEEPQGRHAQGLPAQDNHCDCGIYLIGYLAKFLQDPAAFISKQAYGQAEEDPAWEKFKPSVMRQNIRDIIRSEHALSESQLARPQEGVQSWLNRRPPSAEPFHEFTYEDIKVDLDAQERRKGDLTPGVHVAEEVHSQPEEHKPTLNLGNNLLAKRYPTEKSASRPGELKSNQTRPKLSTTSSAHRLPTIRVTTEPQLREEARDEVDDDEPDELALSPDQREDAVSDDYMRSIEKAAEAKPLQPISAVDSGSDDSLVISDSKSSISKDPQSKARSSSPVATRKVTRASSLPWISSRNEALPMTVIDVDKINARGGDSSPLQNPHAPKNPDFLDNIKRQHAKSPSRPQTRHGRPN